MSRLLIHPKHDKIPSSNIPIASNSKEKLKICIADAKKTDDKVTIYETENDLIPIPYLDFNNKQRSAIFISGISGTGKSTMAFNLVKKYRDLYKDNSRHVILFTTTDEMDPAFQKLTNMTYINIANDKDFLQLVPEHLKDKIIIFDDFENLGNKALRNFTCQFIKDTLERGRKMNINIIIITHQTQNYQFTRPIIFECDTYILFPSSNQNSFSKFATAYLGLSKQEIAQIIEDTNERFNFVCFRKSCPRYYLTKNKVQIL